MAKTVVIVGTLDTKGEELRYIKELVERRGQRTIVVDAGVLGEPLFRADISRQEVAEAAGTNLKEVIALGDWRQANMLMAEGAAKIAQRLYSEGKLDGIIGVGGSMGTTLGLTVMKALPLFLPKLMVSTLALSPFMRSETVSKDLTIMPTMVDLWGGISSGIIRTVLENAAGAISGMVETHERRSEGERPLIAITSLGTPGCMFEAWAKPILEGKGYDVAIFPGFGTAYEEAVEGSLISGALDFMCCAQLINEVCGGLNRPGPIRFEAGKRRAIPQVFAPAVTEFFSYPPPLDPLPAHLQGRRAWQRSAFIIAVKATTDEMARAGELMAQRLNEMSGPTAMLLPARGFSEFDRPDATLNFYDPEGRRAFIEAVKKHVKPPARVMELDLHINDADFAKEAVAILDEMMKTS